MWYNSGVSEYSKVPQQTIVRARGFAGAALHCGRKICVRLLPASENAGIVFRRTDLGGAEVRAAAECVSETNLATGFKSGKAEVCTVEHLLSALAATGVDNVIVELDGPEIPIADGSANPWLLLLRHCRLRQQQAAKRFVRVLRPVEVCDGERRARFSPLKFGGGLTYSARIDYPHRGCLAHGAGFVLRPEPANLRARNQPRANFRLHPRCGGDAKGEARPRRLAGLRRRLRRPSRAERGRAAVCGRVYSPQNLDAIGDCYAGGVLIAGQWRGELPGHDLNNKLVRKLMATADAWEWAEAEEGAAETEKAGGRFSLSPFPVLRPLAV